MMIIRFELQKFRFGIINLTRRSIMENIHFSIRRISTPFPDATQISVCALYLILRSDIYCLTIRRLICSKFIEPLGLPV